MKMDLLQLFGLLVILTYSFLTYAKEESDPSLQANMFGNCNLQEVLSYPSYSDSSSVFNVYTTKAAARNSEMKEYLSMPHTLTQVNEKLAEGIVKGVSMANGWVSRKDNSWQYPEQHPRRNKSHCVQMNRDAVQQPVAVYSNMRRMSTNFYLLMKRHVLVHESGIVGSPCGYYQALEGCETTFRFIGRKWHEQCTRQLRRAGIEWINATSSLSPLLQPSNFRMCRDNVGDVKGMNYSYVSQLFVASSFWDNNYHHLVIDTLPRLIRYLPYLQQHREVKIHVRRFERYNKPLVAQRSLEMKRRVMRLLGLDFNRLVSGPVIAQEAMVPRSMMCNMPVLNSLEVRLVANHLLNRAEEVDIEKTSSTMPYFPFTALPRAELPLSVKNKGSNPKMILVQVRHCHKGMRCQDWRSWDVNTTSGITTALQRMFPSAQVLVTNDSLVAAADCLACELRQYRKVDLLVGLHGAGMTNMIFMKPNSVVLEITGQYDGRMMAGCGYHGNLASIFGVHHYLYYYDWKGRESIDSLDLSQRAMNFYSRTRPRVD